MSDEFYYDNIKNFEDTASKAAVNYAELRDTIDNLCINQSEDLSCSHDWGEVFVYRNDTEVLVGIDFYAATTTTGGYTFDLEMDKLLKWLDERL